MRKVTEKAARALHNREAYKSGNTEVRQFTHDTAFWGLFLHGNCIAMYGAGTLHLKDCGWRSATTKERLNGILSEFDRIEGIFQKDYKWYVQDNHPDAPVIEWQGELTLVEA